MDTPRADRHDDRVPVASLALLALVALAPWPMLRSVPEILEYQKAFVVRLGLMALLVALPWQRAASRRVDPFVGLLLVANVSWIALHAAFHRPEIRAEQLAVWDRVLAFGAFALAHALPVEEKQTRRWLTVLTAGAAALAVFAFFRAYGPGAASYGRARLVVGPFSHPNLLAQYLAIFVPVAAGLYWGAPTPARRRFHLLLYAILIIPFVLTYTRGALIAAGAGTVLLGLTALRGSSNRAKAALRIGAIAAVTVLGLLVMWGFDRPSPKRNAVMEEAAGERSLERSSTSGRISLWRQSLAVIEQHPWTGCGAGRMKQCLALVRRPEDPEKKFQHKDAHQDYLQVAAEYGAPALALYLAFLALVYEQAFRRRHSSASPDLGFLSASMLAGAGAFLLHGLVDFPLSRSAPRLAAFALMGWATALNRIGDERVEPPAFRRQAAAALIVLCVGLWGLVVAAPDAREALRFRDATRHYAHKDRTGGDARCRDILDDRGSEFTRRWTCYRAMAPRLGLESLVLLGEMAGDYPGDYRVAVSRALADVRARRFEAACREVERGIALWDRHPRWPFILDRALANDLPQRPLYDCRRIHAGLTTRDEEELVVP